MKSHVEFISEYWKPVSICWKYGQQQHAGLLCLHSAQ